MAVNETSVANRNGNSEPGREKVELGVPEVWVKRTPQGRISTVRAVMALHEAQKELAVIDGTPMITADGYFKMNQVASLAVITPDSIRIPDAHTPNGVREVTNPFPVIDPESGTQRGVWVKKLAVGYSPIGSLAVTSTTLYYDFTMYFLADLQRKVQFNKEAGRLCFEHQLTDEEKAKGIFLRIEGQLGIWANMEHAEVLKAVSTWLANKHFGERKAQTVAERNALKRHPALSTKLSNMTGANGQRVGRVAVIGWQHDHDWRDLAEIAHRADAGEDLTFDGKPVEVTHEQGDVAEEDVMAAADDIDPDAVPAGESDDEPGAQSGERRLF